MKEIDRYAIEKLGIPSTLLMEHAASAVAETVWQLMEQTPHMVTVFCGAGNNGGDGVACARLLLKRGCRVRCFLCGAREKMTADTTEMEHRLIAAGGLLEPFSEETARNALEQSAVAVDALFGTGLNAPLRGIGLQAAQLINQSAVQVVSCDIASGVATDTGEILGEAVHADVTVTFSMAKPGQLLAPGLYCTGRLEVVPIGIPEQAMENREIVGTLLTEEKILPLFPRRRRDAHKGDFGKLLLLCGSVGFTGAAAMAARAALRSGAGLVSLGVPRTIYPILAAKLDEAMVFPLPEDENGHLSAEAATEICSRLSKCDACLFGPGLGRGVGVLPVLEAILQQKKPVVLDADGINALEGHIDVLRGAACPVVLTPHDGEFARLGGDLQQFDRFQAATELARTTGSVVVLKGYRTVITDGAVLSVNTTGNPGMATGGSGDVLAGILVSFLGQGLAPLDAAQAAVYLHGAAGDHCAATIGEYGMLPSDLIDAIPRLLP